MADTAQGEFYNGSMWFMSYLDENGTQIGQAASNTTPAARVMSAVLFSSPAAQKVLSVGGIRTDDLGVDAPPSGGFDYYRVIYPASAAACVFIIGLCGFSYMYLQRWKRRQKGEMESSKRAKALKIALERNKARETLRAQGIAWSTASGTL